MPGSDHGGVELILRFEAQEDDIYAWHLFIDGEADDSTLDMNLWRAWHKDRPYYDFRTWWEVLKELT